MEKKNDIIAKAYKEYSRRVLAYIRHRINSDEEAEDIMQDAFLRLIDYDMIREDTVRNLIFIIANNLVVDHLRRHYKRLEVHETALLMEQQKTVIRPDEDLQAHDIEELEMRIVAQMSPATARVYEMTRYQELTIAEIADELSLSKRTVECHQFRSRKYVREQLRMVL